MGLKEKNLADGEEIQLDLRTHWKALVPPVLLLVVVIGCLAGVAAATGDVSWGGWALAAVGVVALVIVVIGVLIPLWRWNSTRYVITNRRVSHRYGLITRRGRDIPLYRINDIGIEMGPLDRILRCGTLVISDATEQAGMELSDVPSVEQVQVALQNLLFAHDDGTDDGERPPTEPRRERGH